MEKIGTFHMKKTKAGCTTNIQFLSTQGGSRYSIVFYIQQMQIGARKYTLSLFCDRNTFNKNQINFNWFISVSVGIIYYP